MNIKKQIKKSSAKKNRDDLRPEYDLAKLKGGVRDKYYRQSAADTNLVLIESELSDPFPDAESVNRAFGVSQILHHPSQEKPDNEPPNR